jgi:DNA repair protein SbcD/Mre11
VQDQVDLFDRPNPALDDARMGTDALRRLSEIAPVVVICGNHDSQAMFSWLDSLIGSDRIIFVDQPLEPDRGGVRRFELGGHRVRLGCLPFISANRMVRAFEDPTTWTVNYADRVRRMQNALGAALVDGYDPKHDVLLFAAHLHVTGARATQSERQLHVSDSYAAHADALPEVAYAAFGHIHRPQKLPSAPGWYAGSPVPLDFGEEGEDKISLLVEIEPGRPAHVTELPYTQPRPLVRLSGTLEELAESCAQVKRAICQVTVVSDDPVDDLPERLAELLPHADLMPIIEDCKARRTEVLSASDLDGLKVPTLAESLHEYLAEHPTSTATATEVLEAFDVLLDGAHVGELPHFAVLGDEPQADREATA